MTNFIVYMLAMVGVVMLAFFVFKNSMCKTKESNGKCLHVIDTLSLGARKNLYVISAGQENFLIASDAERTTFLTKLRNKSDCENSIPAIASEETDKYATQSYTNIGKMSANRSQYIDSSIINMNTKYKMSGNSVMRSLAEKIKE
ncbi:MAG: flagellar biosynthetic protein FliO [bacterium]|nr:flagellar biosynthetic protein FliO [bacterium]